MQSDAALTELMIGARGNTESGEERAGAYAHVDVLGVLSGWLYYRGV